MCAPVGDQRSPTRHKAGHASGGHDALTGNLDANARIIIRQEGQLVGTRRAINLAESLGIGLIVADDAQAEEVDLTVVVTGKFPDNVVLPKTSGKGIQVDTAAPTFGWRDILGHPNVRAIGANDPVLAVYQGGIRQFQFHAALLNEVHLEYHIPHDYLPGSDIHIHAHWSQAVVDTGGAGGTPGTCKWQFEVSYAKGHGQAAFPAPKVAFAQQVASAVQYQHMLAEVQVSTPGGAADKVDTSLLEPDGILLVRVFRDPGDAADTLNQGPFLHFVDLHYQSTSVATKQKAPPFYT